MSYLFKMTWLRTVGTLFLVCTMAFMPDNLRAAASTFVVLEGVEKQHHGSDDQLLITLSDEAPINVFQLQSPHRLVIDIAHAKIAEHLEAQSFEQQLLSHWSFQTFTNEAKNIARMVLTFAEAVDYHVQKQGYVIEITYRKKTNPDRTLQTSVFQKPSEKISEKQDQPPLEDSVGPHTDVATAQGSYTLDGIEQLQDNVFLLRSQQIPPIRQKTMEDPCRLVMDLLETVKGKTVPHMYRYPQSLSSKIRLGEHAYGTRVVFDLSHQGYLQQQEKTSNGLLLTFAAKKTAKRPMLSLTKVSRAVQILNNIWIEIQEDGNVNIHFEIEASSQHKLPPRLQTENIKSWKMILNKTVMHPALAERFELFYQQQAIGRLLIKTLPQQQLEIKLQGLKPQSFDLERTEKGWLWQINRQKNDISLVETLAVSNRHTAGFESILPLSNASLGQSAAAPEDTVSPEDLQKINHPQINSQSLQQAEAILQEAQQQSNEAVGHKVAASNNPEAPVASVRPQEPSSGQAQNPKSHTPALQQQASKAYDRSSPEDPNKDILLLKKGKKKLQKLLTLDLKDADILNVLRLISEETSENIITSDEVKGKITLRLHDVPADEALDMILHSKGFDQVTQHNIIRIAAAETIQKEREMELAKRRSLHEVEETMIKMITINYATASEVVEQLKPMLTNRGSAQVDNRTNTIILQDLANNLERLVELSHRLDKQTPLVMIQARIVEANAQQAQNLGIQWGGSAQHTSRTGNPTGLIFPGELVLNGAADSGTSNQAQGVTSPSHYAVNLPANLSGQGGAIGFVLGNVGGSDLLNLRLSAMESNGTGKIISSPEVATLDNRTARVSQGVQIPVSVVSSAGTNTRFIPALLELEVTPHVTNDGTVLMKIKVQKSEPDNSFKGAQGDPSIRSKNAETEVLVKDGDTSVIGGIYTRNQSESLSYVPFFSQLPLLGLLFKSRSVQDTRAELLVFITPRIMNREESMIQNNVFEASPTSQANAP